MQRNCLGIESQPRALRIRLLSQMRQHGRTELGAVPTPGPSPNVGEGEKPEVQAPKSGQTGDRQASLAQLKVS